MSYVHLNPVSDTYSLMVTGVCGILPESKGGPWSWFGPRMLIHFYPDLAVRELFPVEIQRCEPAISTGAKHSFRWNKNITFHWSFLNYCLQKASKPEIKVTQNKG